MNLHDMIIKRKSFHKFKEILPFEDADIREVEDFIENLKPLHGDISFEVKLVPSRETSCKLGAEYCVLFYSEKKGDYLRNIGYLGSQLDLFAVSKNIGTLWYGFGKTECKSDKGLDYVIMIALSKVKESLFRMDMDEASRKDLSKIWSGDSLGLAPLCRLAPSAVNSQPWFVEVEGKELFVYRTSAKLGFVPIPKLKFYNCIDMGIFLYYLEASLREKGLAFSAEYYPEKSEVSEKRLLSAVYRLES